MPLASSCLRFVGASLYVKPGYGWGWSRGDDPAATVDYGAIEVAGGFIITVAEITPYLGELRHILGRVHSPHPLLAGYWISAVVMIEGTFDFERALCLRYDLTIGPKRPATAQPQDFTGSPLYIGSGIIADSPDSVEQFMLSMLPPKA
jgi:hypothetical protein